MDPKQKQRRQHLGKHQQKKPKQVYHVSNEIMDEISKAIPKQVYHIPNEIIDKNPPNPS